MECCHYIIRVRWTYLHFKNVFNRHTIYFIWPPSQSPSTVYPYVLLLLLHSMHRCFAIKWAINVWPTISCYAMLCYVMFPLLVRFPFASFDFSCMFKFFLHNFYLSINIFCIATCKYHKKSKESTSRMDRSRREVKKELSSSDTHLNERNGAKKTRTKRNG